MPRSKKKLVFAGVMLVTAVVAAMLFRRPRPVDEHVPDIQPPALVLRNIDPSLTLPIPEAPEPTPVTGQLLGSIEASEHAPPAKPAKPAATHAERTVEELPEPLPAGPPAVAAAPGTLPSAWPNDATRTAPSPASAVTVPTAASTGSSEAGVSQPRSSRWQIHQVQEGETLSSLARRYLGSADRYAELFEANRDVLKSPNLLPLGVELKIPTAIDQPPADQPAAEAGALRSAPLVPIAPGTWRRGRPAETVARSYRVRGEETLADIAREVYGDGQRGQELYEANRDQLPNPDALREGLLLVIP